MMPIHAQKSAQTLARLPLSLCERLALILQGLEANLADNFAGISDSATSSWALQE